MEVLSSPLWQGIGVILTLVLGLIGFYYAGKNKFWLYASGAFTILVIGFGLGSQLSKESQNGSNTPIAVDATKDWQPTGIFVAQGDKVTITVVGGGWTPWRQKLTNEELLGSSKDLQGREIYYNVWSENAGEGGGTRCIDFSNYNPLDPCPVPTFPFGSLVARINKNEPFGVGNISKFTASDTGMLYLRINDGQSQGLKYLADNGGVLAVEIEHEQ